MVRLLAVLLVGLVAGCVPPVAPRPTAAATSSAAPEETADPALAAARVDVGAPAVRVVEHALDAARRIDFIRHEVPRGAARAAALADARAVVAELDSSIGTLEAAVIALPAALTDVRVSAGGLADRGRAIAREVTVELDAVEPYVQLDLDMELVVEAWTIRGSRSEFVDRLGALVADADAVVGRARRLRTPPQGCAGPRTNRIRWAEVVRTRTVALLQVAEAREGTTYDELRDRYSRAPVGEDRVAADAESRPCWAERTGLLTAPSELEGHLDALEAALQG